MVMANQPPCGIFTMFAPRKPNSIVNNGAHTRNALACRRSHRSVRTPTFDVTRAGRPAATDSAKKGARITGADRVKLATALEKEYHQMP